MRRVRVLLAAAAVAVTLVLAGCTSSFGTKVSCVNVKVGDKKVAEYTWTIENKNAGKRTLKLEVFNTGVSSSMNVGGETIDTKGVAKDQSVTFTYKMTGKSGKVLDTGPHGDDTYIGGATKELTNPCPAS